VTPPSLLILGTDAVLAAAPATPVQLAHACQVAGFRAVIPASWGDELIAERALQRMAVTAAPMLQCSCPLVASRFAAHAELASMMFCSVAPPVATALYLRAVYAPAQIHITFVGACPSGSHASIDEWLTLEALSARLVERGIRTTAQPTEFDSVLPPDRRRHFSEPGGVPARNALHLVPAPADIIELPAQDFAVDLAQHLLANSRSLINVAPALGCACSGAAHAVAPEVARARVREHEPPRAPSPIVDHSLAVPIEAAHAREATTPSAPRAPAPQPFSPAAPVSQATATESAVALAESARRRSPPAGSPPSRAVLGTMPQSRTAGRQLPRAYVARRRTPRGTRQSGVRRQEAMLGIAGGWRRPRWLLLGAAAAVALVVVIWLIVRAVS
jgi:hypothetical protein